MADSGHEMQARVRVLRPESEAALAEAADAAARQAGQDRFLGRKAGRLTDLLKSLGTLSAEERPQAGQLLNALKADLELRLEGARAAADARARDARLLTERLDLTLPDRRPARGRRHPL